MCGESEPVEELEQLDLTEAILLNTQEIHSLRYAVCQMIKILERIADELGD